MIRPILIAVEGIDGAGKSTQIPRIAAWFARHGIETDTSCEPTHGPLGTKIRTAPVRLAPAEERRLFVEDRRDHLQDRLLPAIARGAVAITDRYFYSSVAYQGTRRDAFDHEPSDAELARLQDEIYAENRAFAPEADVLVYIRLDVDTALARMRASREGLDPFENRRNLLDVAAAFERIVTRHPCVITADATKSLDEVTAEIERGLDRIFTEK